MLIKPTFANSSVLFSSGEFQVELCITPEQLEAALAARARFYETVEDLSVSPHGDEFDFQANAKVFVVKREKEILGTIRNIAYTPSYYWADCQISKYYPEALNSIGGIKTPLLESNRFAISSYVNRKTAFKIQGMLFRVQKTGFEVEKVKYMTTLVRPQHIGFYKKYMGMHAIAEAKELLNSILVPISVAPPAECTFPYSLPETLGIDMDTCVARYKVLKQRLRASFTPRLLS